MGSQLITECVYCGSSSLYLTHSSAKEIHYLCECGGLFVDCLIEEMDLIDG